MSKHYPLIAFTDDVREVQTQHGSAAFYDRKRVAADGLPGRDALTEDEKTYLGERDSLYLATVSETGWPYVQFRGGPRGFIRVLDEHTIAWADFRGNLQYVSTGNLGGDDRVAIIAVDYAHRTRLKIFGRARVVTAQQDPEMALALTDPAYDAVVERSIIIAVEAYDWNCPQHIIPRFSAAELEPAVAGLQHQLQALHAENAVLRAKLDSPE